MHAANNLQQNIINQSRSSSLRKVDMLKGKFEGIQQQPNNNSPHIQRIPLDLPRNPVLERLTGKNIAASRNDSYYKVLLKQITLKYSNIIILQFKILVTF